LLSENIVLVNEMDRLKQGRYVSGFWSIFLVIGVTNVLNVGDV